VTERLAALFGVAARFVDEALEEGEVLACLGMPENPDDEGAVGVLDGFDRPVMGVSSHA
jgi:hypothetical protein